MQWEQKETGMKQNPYYYVCKYENMELSIYPPYGTDPWSTKLIMNDLTIHKDDFRLKDGEGLKEAKEIAFKIMVRYLKIKADYWTRLRIKLVKMRRSDD